MATQTAINSTATCYTTNVRTVPTGSAKNIQSQSYQVIARSKTINDMMNAVVVITSASSSAYSSRNIIMKTEIALDLDDIEIAAMSREEIKSAIYAQFGSRADDEIDDDWLDNMRRGSDDRFFDLLNPPGS